jgi:hypothetical protein
VAEKCQKNTALPAIIDVKEMAKISGATSNPKSSAFND